MKCSLTQNVRANVENMFPCVQGAILRAGFPKDVMNQPVYGVLDDSHLQSVIKQGKAWIAKSRQCLQTMQAARPVACSSLTNLLEEAKSIQLNLAPEVRSLCTNHPNTLDPLRDSNTQKEARETLAAEVDFFFSMLLRTSLGACDMLRRSCHLGGTR